MFLRWFFWIWWTTHQVSLLHREQRATLYNFSSSLPQSTQINIQYDETMPNINIRCCHSRLRHLNPNNTEPVVPLNNWDYESVVCSFTMSVISSWKPYPFSFVELFTTFCWLSKLTTLKVSYTSRCGVHVRREMCSNTHGGVDLKLCVVEVKN